jgi:hypothetical protein
VVQQEFWNCRLRLQNQAGVRGGAIKAKVHTRNGKRASFLQTHSKRLMQPSTQTLQTSKKKPLISKSPVNSGL